MIIRYETAKESQAWHRPSDFLKNFLAGGEYRQILEVGSGANPTLAPDYVRANSLHYVTSDVDKDELKKAAAAFECLVVDFSANVDPALFGKFDCVFSHAVNEHIRDAAKYHRNIFNILRPGGVAVHCFTTLWAVPFALNRLLPDSLTDMLLKRFAPRDEVHHGKFKAYYRWCRGPTPVMIQRFQSLGYEILEYIGCFGHYYYGKKLPWLHRLEEIKMRYLLRHPVPQLCSYSTVILRKPQ
jgi:SAM-dependent methyltransferase